MLKATVSKVMWVGRATVFLIGFAVILAVVFGLASTAFGANGDAWKLGQGNVATKLTSLGGTLGVNGAMLKVANKNGGTDDTALRLEVQPGEAPISVNSATQVTNLNADQVDGKSAFEFMPRNVYKTEATTDIGTAAGNTEKKAMFCDGGDLLLSGGPASVDEGSKVLDSYPSDPITWTARIYPDSPSGDEFTVVIMCADFPPSHT
jgi:hypothetical protein